MAGEVVAQQLFGGEPMAEAAVVPVRKSLIGNPVCVGVGGFAITTTCLGLHTTGLLPAGAIDIVLILAAFYGGVVQMVAGFFALAKGETFAASFMTAYGAFWLTYVALIVWAVPHMGAATGAGVAVYLIMWTLTTFVFTIATLNTNKLVLFVFLEFDVTLILLDIGAVTGNTSVTFVGGILTIILGLLGWYIVMADMVNEMSGRTVFWTGAFKNGPLLAKH
ncbi:MAG TPA: acetate uptake transporter [Nevskiaceae bacterium]|nr:acetate uptake transporter [Nevskiaceae bacterium]